MIAIGILVAIFLGVGGTAVVADNARPGDALFGVDQTVEKIELSLSGESRKDILRLKFAQERVSEIEDIMDEGSEDRLNNRQDDDISSPGQASQPDGADAVEDGKRVVSDENRADIEIGIQALASLLGGVENSELDNELESIIKNLNDRIGSLPEDTRIEVRDDRFEARNESGRIRIDIKDDGEIRLKLKVDSDKSGKNVSGESEDDDGEDKKDDSIGVSGAKNKIGLSEAEIDIFTDITTVKVEINGVKTSFTTLARTRSAIIDEILKRFAGLTRSQMDALLEIEVENRASRADDLKLDSDSDDDDDDDNDDDRSHDNDPDGNRGGNNGQSGRSGRN
ncbi:MAG: DUF5667 domain-containing protein [Patescibacteria group bacterium]